MALILTEALYGAAMYMLLLLNLSGFDPSDNGVLTDL
jgi:hypothetical protein